MIGKNWSSLMLSLLALVPSVSLGAPVGEEVRESVRQWFELFDTHAEPEAFLARTSPTGFSIAFPETTIRNPGDFRAWYDTVRGFGAVRHDVLDVRVVSQDRQSAHASIDVDWSARNLEGSPVFFAAHQEWDLTRSEGAWKISQIVVTARDILVDKEAEDRPSCTCVGGAGGYTYSCPAVASTCTGGPGHYTYTCWICPQ